jgi:hypothetical protein
MKTNIAIATLLTILVSCSKNEEKPIQNDMKEELIEEYIGLWNVTDSISRLEGIREIWSDEGVFLDPFNQGQGAEELNSVITSVREQFPGCSFTSENYTVFENHGIWVWRMYDASQQEIIWGYDYAELDKKGKIVKLIGFTP